MMGITKTSPLSRLGMRLGERRARLGAGASGLTEEDEGNLESFQGILEDTIDLLRKENDALEAKDISQVASYFEEKAKLLEALERRQPVVEPFLGTDIPMVAQLRKLIRDLASQLEASEILLRGMAEASKNILSEIEHLRSRQSLKGVYGKSGQLRGDVSAKPAGKGIAKKL